MFVETSIRNAGRFLVETSIVVAVILFTFPVNAGATFVSLTAIPSSYFRCLASQLRRVLKSRKRGFLRSARRLSQNPRLHTDT